MHRITAEFDLAAACCRWPPSEGRNQRVAAACANVRWPLFRRIAKRHRIEGLVWHGLRQARAEVPAAVHQAFAAAARRIARQNLEHAAESLRLRRLFEADGTRIVFLKGVTLGALAYGNIAVKTAADIDVIVPRDSIEAAAALLEQAGYTLHLPDSSLRCRLRCWHRYWKESVWHNRTSGIIVELHSDLADDRMLVSNIDPFANPREVSVATGISLPTLPHDELFAYLCVHGASSAWFRLKWVADFAALLSSSETSEIERLYRRSQELGAGRAAAQALLLTKQLFGTKIGERLGGELGSNRINRWLVGGALRTLAGGTLITEVRQKRLGTVFIHLTQFGLLPGARYKFRQLWRQLVTPFDRLALPLPRPLHFLYPFVSFMRRVGLMRI